ncbi:MAG TPA: acyl-CoA desaturase [Myxococcales bacterium]
MSVVSSKVRFSSGEFNADLKRRVDEYFELSGRKPRGGWSLHLQTAVMLLWLAASYGVLMFASLPAWLVPPLAVSLGLAVAGVGFNVMHDANHGAYSPRRLVNRAMAYSLDLIGGSSYLWRQKHNVLHHTYTNIAGLDTDGDVGIFLRLTPSQPLRRFHRYQHLYAWLLYSVFALKWWFFDDFRELITGRIVTQPYPRPTRRALASTLVGKALFFGWAFVLPLVFHPTWWLVPIWLLASATTGVVLASVFQLAHCVGEAAHLDPGALQSAPQDWAAHQVTSTVDFARGNRLLRWYVGGLNFQVEHHLFTKISHTRYPEISPIVEKACLDHGVRYRSQPTLRAALAANLRYLRRLGRELSPAPSS